MSLVASRLSLTHRCTIERQQAAAAGRWGQTPPPSVAPWEDHLVDVPCRASATTGKEYASDGVTLVDIVSVRLLLPLGTDVTTEDRIASVTDRGGNSQEGPLGVRAILSHRDHLELILVRVG